jgi:type II secretory pathway component PulF
VYACVAPIFARSAQLVALTYILLGVIATGLEMPFLAIVFIGMAAWCFWLVFLKWKAARSRM